jgi:transcriptional regulator with XRE-family HTH domain
MEIKKSFWNKVRTFRKSLWLSQEELAFKVKLHRTYIWIVERGEKNISLENIEKLAKALWVKVKDLFD